MKRKRVLLLLCILSCTLQLFAQQINVQGVVYDPSGETVPGVANTSCNGRTIRKKYWNGGLPTIPRTNFHRDFTVPTTVEMTGCSKKYRSYVVKT